MCKLKGYSDGWIEKRMCGIAIREELTDEWQNRGAREEKDYKILTAEISKATCGVTPGRPNRSSGDIKKELFRIGAKETNNTRGVNYEQF